MTRALEAESHDTATRDTAPTIQEEGRLDTIFTWQELARLDEALTMSARETGLRFTLYIGDLGTRTRLRAEEHREPGAFTLLRNRGDGTFERTDFPANGAAWFCALGDLDGDGRPDLILSYPWDARIAVAHNTGGGFAAPVPYASRPGSKNLALADLDGDGRLDVLVLIAPNSVGPDMPELDRGSVAVYPGAGDGTLRPSGRAAL